MIGNGAVLRVKVGLSPSKKCVICFIKSYLKLMKNSLIRKIEWGYYATFKVKKIQPLLYKIDTCLQKTNTCTGLQAEKIFSVNI